MVYSYRTGVVVPFFQKFKKQLILAVAAVFMASMAAFAFSAAASSHAFTWEFTQAELDANWEGDRTFPTGGVASVSAFGRDNVAQLSLDSTATASSTFHRTEGIKTVGDFGSAVQADLYVDGAWDGQPVRNGLWADGTVGAEPHVDGPWGIIEFTTEGEDDFTGWRVWTSDVGWTNLPGVDFSYDEWATLLIELDEADQEFDFYINGDLVHTGNAPSSGDPVTHLGTTILNSYNYGLEDGSDYMAHWNGGLPYEESGEITAPATDGELVSGDVTLAATYDDGNTENDDAVQWAVRSNGECNVGASTVLGNVNGHSDAAAWDGATFEFEYDSTTLPDGEYCFVFNPTDDNVDVRETRTYVVDNTAPLVTVDDPADGDEVDGAVGVLGTVADDNLSHYNASLYPDTTDLSDGLTHSGDRLESNTVNTPEFVNQEVLNFDSATYEDGEYQVRLAARDLAGNRDVSDPFTGGTSSVHVISVLFDNYVDNKKECKNGGWERGTFEGETFRNQGDCVSFFASNNDNGHGHGHHHKWWKFWDWDWNWNRGWSWWNGGHGNNGWFNSSWGFWGWRW